MTVDGIDPKGDFINFLDGQLGVVNPDKRQSVVELEQVAPGRYRGTFGARDEGVYLAGLTTRREQQSFGSQIVGTVVPYAQEYRELGANEGFLREVSELTGGGPLSDAKEVFTAEPAALPDSDGPVALAGGARDRGAGAGDRDAPGRPSSRAARVVEDKEVATMARRTGRRVQRMRGPMLGLLVGCALWAALGGAAWAKPRPVLILPYQSPPRPTRGSARPSPRRSSWRRRARPRSCRSTGAGPMQAARATAGGRRSGSEPAGPRARRQGRGRLPRRLPADGRTTGSRSRPG